MKRSPSIAQKRWATGFDPLPLCPSPPSRSDQRYTRRIALWRQLLGEGHTRESVAALVEITLRREFPELSDLSDLSGGKNAE